MVASLSSQEMDKQQDEAERQYQDNEEDGRHPHTLFMSFQLCAGLRGDKIGEV